MAQSGNNKTEVDVLWRKLQLDWRYAVGEFLIVVLGVLTALAVDNWNRDRLDRNLEQNYLSALIRDLESDLESLDITLERSEMFGKQSSMLLSAVETGSIEDPLQFLRAAAALSRLTFPTVAPTTYDDLLSTGNIQVIEEEIVRTHISRYYVDIEDRAQWQLIWRSHQEQMARLVPRVIGLVHRAYMDTIDGRETSFPDWYKQDDEVTMQDAEEVLSRIVNDQEVIHAIENMHRTRVLNYNRSRRQEQKVVDLISILTEYSQTL